MPLFDANAVPSTVMTRDSVDFVNGIYDAMVAWKVNHLC
jgi:hypothetical protein